ncbi:MAG: polysaccharide pyruvyl transferase family protein [Bacteroidales bacterium]|nr:polysaccharide pyruvyl transferase family protein [Bacteroidales bacterium]
MKVGILTFHRAYNYGAILQAYCLQEYLKSLGHDSYIIDYKPAFISKYKPTLKNVIKSGSIISSLLKLSIYPLMRLLIEKRQKTVSRFFDRYNLFPYNGIDSLESFDAIALGSDQIWNPAITGGNYDPLFWGVNFPCRVFSYAASSKQKQLSPSDETFIKDAFLKLHRISVRESTVRDLLQPLTDKNISVVLDPTLLVDAKLLRNLTANQKIPTRPYVLIYEVSYHESCDSFALNLGKKYGLDVIRVASSVGLVYYKKNVVRNASVQEFLALIAGATCVVTTSFHGTSLSIALDKNFYTILTHKVEDERMISLLGKIGLENHLVEADYIPEVDTIESSLIFDRKRLDDFRKESVDYIADALI